MYMMVGYKNDTDIENNFTVMNYYTGETKEISEEKLCRLIKMGKIMDFEDYKGCSLSKILLPILNSKTGKYNLTARIIKDSTNNIYGYVFRDKNGKNYMLKCDQCISLFQHGKVQNVEYDEREGSIKGKNGTNLRNIPEIRIY